MAKDRRTSRSEAQVGRSVTGDTPEGRQANPFGLPADVNYGFVKAIVFDTPIDPLAMALLRPDRETADATVRLFRGKSYGRILDAIATDEERVRAAQLVGDVATRPALESLASKRRLVYEALLAEPAFAQAGLAVRRTPTRSTAESSWMLRIEVWRPPTKKQAPKMLDERTLGPQASIDKYARMLRELLDAHAPMAKLLRLRYRRTWWTNRRSPEAFPVVTQYLIPKLYDYLSPSYRVRPYAQGRGAERGPGAFSSRLMRDMTAILCFERSDLCAALTPSQVRSAVRHHLQTAKSNRPRGEEMFRVGRRYVASPRRRGPKTRS